MKRNRTVAAGVLVLIVYVLSALIRFIPSEVISGDVNPYLALAVLQILIFVIPSLIYTKLRFPNAVERLRLRPFGLRHILFLAAAVFVVILGSSLINYAMYSAFPETYVASSSTAEVAGSIDSAAGGVYAILAFAVVPALCEEYLFRSVICAEFECAGIGCAVFFSALLFAMSHFSFMRLPVYLFSGLCLTAVMYVTRSVFASMIVHAAANTFSLFFESFVYKVVNRQGIVLFIFLAALLFLVSLAIALGEAEKTYRQRSKDDTDASYRLRKKDRISFFEAALSPAILVAAAFYIVMSFVG